MLLIRLYTIKSNFTTTFYKINCLKQFLHLTNKFK
nr:MAG TPA: hypothetical protein [Caudoviricetes sp.]